MIEGEKNGFKCSFYLLVQLPWS